MLVHGKQIKDESIDKVKLSFPLSYTHTQAIASNVWTIQHNLNKYTTATIYDSTGEEIWGQIKTIDLNNIEVSFNEMLVGKVSIT